MAHANPEFALGLMRPNTVPVSQLADNGDRLGISGMRWEIARIQRLVKAGQPLSPRDKLAWRAWTTGLAHIDASTDERGLNTAPHLNELSVWPVGTGERGGNTVVSGPLRGGAAVGERFVQPKRKLTPADRIKLNPLTESRRVAGPLPSRGVEDVVHVKVAAHAIAQRAVERGVAERDELLAAREQARLRGL